MNLQALVNQANCLALRDLADQAERLSCRVVDAQYMAASQCSNWNHNTPEAERLIRLCDLAKRAERRRDRRALALRIARAMYI